MVRSNQKHFIESEALINKCKFSIHLASHDVCCFLYATRLDSRVRELGSVNCECCESHNCRCACPPERVCARLRLLYVGARLPAGPKVAAVRDAATSYFLCVPLRPSIRASDTSNLPRRTSEALLRLRVTRGSCSCPHNSERSHAFILVNSGSALELRLPACLPAEAQRGTRS